MNVSLIILSAVLLTAVSCASFESKVVDLSRDFCGQSVQDRIMTGFAMDTWTAPARMSIECGDE